MAAIGKITFLPFREGQKAVAPMKYRKKSLGGIIFYG